MGVADQLDSVDLMILGVLHHNARVTNKELAAAAGVAPSTCLERVRRLLRLGALKGFHADVDLSALGIGLQAMIAVRMQKHSRELVESFHAYVSQLPEVLAVYHVTGSDDYLVHVAVRDDEHLRDLALDSFTTRPEVGHIETRLIFEHAPTWRLPLLEG